MGCGELAENLAGHPEKTGARAGRAASLVWVLSLLVLLIASAEPAQAYKFGRQDTIHHLQNVEVKGPNGEELFLGHKTSIQFFLAGLYVEDGGYVLGLRNDSSKFYEMPTGEQLAGFQQRGLLPNPLPPYTIDWFTYALGYSLWILLVFLGLWALVDWLRKKAKPELGSPPPATPT